MVERSKDSFVGRRSGELGGALMASMGAVLAPLGPTIHNDLPGLLEVKESGLGGAS